MIMTIMIVIIIMTIINDQIEDYERSKTMIDIQKSLTGGEPKIIKPDRKLIKQVILTSDWSRVIT